MLYQVVRSICHRHNIRVPERLRWRNGEWNGVAVLERNDLKLCVDVSVPTDRQLTERRPDLIVFAKEKRKIIIFDVAYA